MTHLTWRSLILIAALSGSAESAYGSICETSDGAADTACGSGALTNGSSDGGSGNSAFGDSTLPNNTSGSNNTASGVSALQDNKTGSNNTASGGSALVNNTNGSNNTASGVYALAFNMGGSDNTASGVNALYSNQTGSYNTAVGANALQGYEPEGGTPDSTGSNNTGIGANALYSYTTGNDNTASGYEALYSNTNGTDNTASGYEALYANKGGNSNTASGQGALHNNTSGNRNIAVGFQAGFDLTTGSNNIDVGSPGVAGESGMIRIGTISSSNVSTQSAAYIAGISGVTVSGAYVCVNSDGQLGTNGSGCATTSSRRYKEDIQPMAELSERLLKLRPVTFRYKTADAGGHKSIQYGLIAEEVADALPELVVFDKDGQPDAVMYQALTPMLLNEVQKQAAEIRDLKQQQKQSVAQAEQLRDVQHQLATMRATLLKLQAKDALVAQR